MWLSRPDTVAGGFTPGFKANIHTAIMGMVNTIPTFTIAIIAILMTAITIGIAVIIGTD